MQFMMGTYCELASGVTLSTTMRGLVLREAAEVAEKASVEFRRLMSVGGTASELGESNDVR